MRRIIFGTITLVKNPGALVEKPASIVSLNGHAVQLPFKYLCLYRRLLLFSTLVKEAALYHGQAIHVQTLN